MSRHHRRKRLRFYPESSGHRQNNYRPTMVVKGLVFEADAELDMLDAVCVLNAGGSVDFLDETKTVEEAFQDEAAPPPPPEIRPDTPWYAKLFGRTSSAKIAGLGQY